MICRVHRVTSVDNSVALKKDDLEAASRNLIKKPWVGIRVLYSLAEFISPQKVYTFSFIVGNVIPKT